MERVDMCTCLILIRTLFRGAPLRKKLQRIAWPMWRSWLATKAATPLRQSFWKGTACHASPPSLHYYLAQTNSLSCFICIDCCCSVTGTNGILKPPKGYLEGLRKICDKHGILIVCDEVMAGFGRTGRLFGFCHAPNFVPVKYLKYYINFHQKKCFFFFFIEK